MIDDFDEYDDLNDYSSDGVFVDAVPISSAKKAIVTETDFNNEANNETKTRAHRMKTNRNRYHHHPKLRKFYDQYLQ